MSVDLEDRPTNIKTVSLDVPQRPEPLFYDPQEVFTATDWTNMLAELNVRRGRDRDKFLATAAAMTMLFPDRRDELELDSVREDLLNTFDNDIETFSNSFEIGQYRQKGALIQLLYPDENIAERMGVTPEKALRSISIMIDGDPMWRHEHVIFDALILLPGIENRLRKMGNLKKALEENSIDSEEFPNSLYNAIAYNVLYPGPKNSAILAQLEHLKGTFPVHKTISSWVHSLPIAATLHLASARNLTIKNHGLQVDEAPPSEKPQPQVPQTKKY